MKTIFPMLAIFGLSACTGASFPGGGLQNANPDVVAPAAVAGRDFPPPPPPNARTVEQFDTTTAEDRAAAVAAASGRERRLGSTIARLGSPTDPGIWCKTPLVSEVTQGRVEYQGKSVNVELRPSGGAQGSGSLISLAAMRLIEAPLTGLPEVVVYAN
ncbi:hypothetical protein N9Q54_02640 [Octadecabacter sp.]|nr:hypothetical protein [Octadecabacter sp.]